MTVNGIDRNYPYFQPVQDTIAPLGSYYNSFTNPCTNPAIFLNTENPLMDTFQFGNTNPGVYTYTSAPAESGRSTSGCIDYFEIKRRKKQEQEQRRAAEEQQRLTEEMEATGLGLSAEEMEIFKRATEKRIAKQYEGSTYLEEFSAYAAFGVATEVGFRPMNNIVARLDPRINYFGQLKGVSLTTSEQIIINEAKNTTRRAIVRSRALLDRGIVGGKIAPEALQTHTQAMDDLIAQLKLPGANKAEILIKIQNRTAAMEQTISSTRGLLADSRRMFGNLCKRVAGKPTTGYQVPNAATYEQAVSRATMQGAEAQIMRNAGNTLGAARSTFFDCVKRVGSKALGAIGKALGPIVVAGMEIYNDWDKLKAAYKEKGTIFNEQTARTTLKTGGAVAGFLATVKVTAACTAKGAAIGSCGGPWGAVIGGAIGFIAGVAISALACWGGRKLGELAGDAIYGKEEAGEKAMVQEVAGQASQEKYLACYMTIASTQEDPSIYTEEELNVIAKAAQYMEEQGIMADIQQAMAQ